MVANTYLNSLGIEITKAKQTTIGRLVSVGEFIINSGHGVLLQPKHGNVYDHYLNLFSDKPYEFVIVDDGIYPSYYVRGQEEFIPVRALSFVDRNHFASTAILDVWAQFAHHGDVTKLDQFEMTKRGGNRASVEFLCIERALAALADGAPYHHADRGGRRLPQGGEAVNAAATSSHGDWRAPRAV